MERFHLYRPPGAGGAFMASADDGPWVRLADAQAAIDAANQRATEAERYVAGQDVRSDFATATEMRAALDAANRRLALAVAEVGKWREAVATLDRQRSSPHCGHEVEGVWDDSGGRPCEECRPWIAADDARRVTDSDPVLAKMVGGEG